MFVVASVTNINPQTFSGPIDMQRLSSERSTKNWIGVSPEFAAEASLKKPSIATFSLEAIKKTQQSNSAPPERPI
jgi:hypothetical protein